MSETKYYVDAAGTYIGGFAGAEPPACAVEVPTAPHDARQVWLGNGWSPVPVDIPEQVTRFQARAALYQAVLLDQVEAAIAAPGTDMMLKLAWQDAQTFKRESQFVAGMAQALGLSAQQLDDLFIAASQIE